MRASTLPLIPALLALACSAAPAPTRVSVDFSREIGPLDSTLWNSAGLIQDLNSKTFDQDMQLVGSCPRPGVAWMRPHDLLDLVSATGWDSEHMAYDWSRLDRCLDVIAEAGMTPLFELMGNPSKHFTSFLERDQLFAWKRLVRDLALHLEERYGAPAVRDWLFESWNEPDIKFEWPWRSPLEQQHYYDACSEGLREADPALRLGGPGVARWNMATNVLLRAFFDHCDTGTNYFTGEKGVRLDFISYHCKKLPAAMVDAEIAGLTELFRLHPAFARKRIMDDEADSEAGWSKSGLPYRGTVWYAAFIARAVNEHLARLVDGRDLPSGLKLDYHLSNDDAFWGPWEFRTQAVRFGDDARFALVKKPSHAVRTALALLPEHRVAVDGPALNDPIGAVAAVQPGFAAVLLYHYADAYAATGPGRVRLELHHVPFPEAQLTLYRIDSAQGDPRSAWERMGSPAVPSDAQVAQLRAASELVPEGPSVEVSGSELSEEIDLPLPGVCVAVLTGGHKASSFDGIIGRISPPRFEKYSSLSGQFEDLMIQWRHFDRGVRSYAVLYAEHPEGPFRRVNPDQLDTAFLLTRAPGSKGYVQVQGLDYSGFPIAESPITPTP